MGVREKRERVDRRQRPESSGTQEEQSQGSQAKDEEG